MGHFGNMHVTKTWKLFYVCSGWFNRKWHVAILYPTILFVLTDQFYTIYIPCALGCYMLFICFEIIQSFFALKHEIESTTLNDFLGSSFSILLSQVFFINHWLMVWQWVSNSIHCIPSRLTIYIRHKTYVSNWLTLKLMDTPYTSFGGKMWIFVLFLSEHFIK